MAAAAAAPPPRRTGAPSPPDPADLGFPAPLSDPAPPPPSLLPGTLVGPVLKLSREDHTPDLKPCHESDSEDVRTTENSEFFLRQLESSDKKITFAHEAFTDEQRVQLHAQILISGYLTHGRPPKETNMILAFGQPVEGQKHAWEEVWRAALDRCQNQMSPMAGLATPPSISLIGSCTVEQDSKDTTVGKSTVTKPHCDLLQDGSGKKETQGQDVERPTKMLEQRNGDEDHLAVSYAQKFDQTPCGEDSRTAEQDWKDTSVCKTISEPHNTEILSNSLLNDFDEKTHEGDESARIKPTKQHPSDDLNVQTANCTQVLSDDVNDLNNSTIWEQSVLDSCLKCGKSGQMLKCCSCPLAAHDSCFGSTGRSDDGQFYCPVCFYSKAAEAYKKAERTLFEAKKNLSGFFGWKRFAKQQDELSTGKQQRATANCENHLSGCCTSKMQCNQQSEAANLSRRDEEIGYQKTNATSYADKENRLVNSPSSAKGFTSVRNTSRRKVSFQEKETMASNSHGKASGRRDQYMHSPARKRYYPYPPECYSTPARIPLAPRRKSFGTTARRTRLVWTPEEEEALREGVARFAPREKGQISWIQIREHGDGVFHPRRLPHDLRQKWNYMKKRDEAAREGAGLAGLDPKARRDSLPPTWRKVADLYDGGA